MEENEQVQSDVEQASSEPSEPAASSAPETSESKSAEASNKQPEQSEENVPFHKHPRWIERDNELKAERQARQEMAQRLEQMHRQMQEFTQPKPTDKFAGLKERLKGIDPEFAEYVSTQLAPAKELEELRNWRQQQELQSQQAYGRSELQRLHDTHKVDASTQARYNAAIEAKVRANPNLRLEDLPRVYKEVHDDYSSWIEGIKRSERESYVKAKQSSAAAPTVSKGTPAKPATKAEWSKNRDEARNQLIQRVLTKAKASSDI